MSDPVRSLQGRALNQAASDLAADSRSLDALKREAQRDPQAAVKKAAQQFEALFMQMVLKSMREAMPKSGMFDSPSQDMYTGMLDQQLAGRIAASGTGLSDVIARQLTRHMNAGTAPAAAPAAAPASAPTAVPASAPTAVPAVAPAAAPAAAAPPRRAAALARYQEIAGSAAAAATPGRAAAAAAAAPAAADPARIAHRDFVTRHWDSAQQAERATGIPARFVLSQAALESGWGRGEIRSADGLPSYNLFGIKAGAGWRGRTVDVATTEYENGVARRVVERFRAYNNYAESFRDWAQLMASNPRYAGVLARGRDAAGFAQGLQQAGYATDPAYAGKLVRVIASVAALDRGA